MPLCLVTQPPVFLSAVADSRSVVKELRAPQVVTWGVWRLEPKRCRATALQGSLTIGIQLSKSSPAAIRYSESRYPVPNLTKWQNLSVHGSVLGGCAILSSDV